MEKAPNQEVPKSMPCDSVDRPIAELKKDGWEECWSFHTNIPEQWNEACDKAEKIQADGFWEVVLVQSQTEQESKDGVAYLCKKKTEKYGQYEKDMGYDYSVNEKK